LRANFTRGVAAVLLLLAAFFPAASAEPYPSQRITLIVPFPPGSATDSVTRHLAESIRAATNATVVVENKPGADGNLAALAVLKAEPDGYTAFVTTNSTQAANISLFNSLPYDPKADFAPVAGIMTIPMMLTVRADFPARSVAEFVALAKKREKPLSFGSGNTSSRGAAELFRYRQGIEMQHVPYRGMPQALTDVMGGHVAMTFVPIAAALPPVRSGKLRALAVTARKRSAELPQVPTIDESGVPGYEAAGWNALLAPKATPRDIITKVNATVMDSLKAPKVREVVASSGAEAAADTPEALGRFLQSEMDKWGKVIRSAGIKGD